MSNVSGSAGVTYERVDAAYFEARGLRRHAGIWSLWALGVAAVISGHFSGWNFGLASGGWGGMFVATVAIALMYTGLTCCLAEMSPAMPHTGGAYSFARTAFGPWGGFLTGLAENVEYVMTAAVIVFFIGTYGVGILDELLGAGSVGPQWQPLFWVFGYIVFVGLNTLGVEQSFRFSVLMAVLSLLCLAVFYVSAAGMVDFRRWALDIAPDGSRLAAGNGPLFPMGWQGVFAALPFAVWLFLAIEQLPLAAEESVDPRRDMPKGIMLGMATLIVSAFCVLVLNPAIAGVGAHALGSSGEPLLDGFRAIYGTQMAVVLAAIAVIGLVASFHAIIYACGRQVYSLSRAGYFPRGLSLTHGTRKSPHVAMIVSALVGLAVMFAVWFTVGADRGAKLIGGTLLNMAVFGAMFSYLMQALTFLRLRSRFPEMPRPFRSPLGNAGAWVTIVIAVVTIVMQLRDPAYQAGVLWVVAWFIGGAAYFALVGRHRLILSPEEEFARAWSDVLPGPD